MDILIGITCGLIIFYILSKISDNDLKGIGAILLVLAIFAFYGIIIGWLIINRFQTLH